MRQLLERPVSLRLSVSMYRRYEAAAMERGMPLSAYLRDRLEVEDQIAEHVGQLRLTLMDTPSHPLDRTVLSILLELLLLERRAASPADRRAIHHELERQGMTPWTPAQAIDTQQ